MTDVTARPGEGGRGDRPRRLAQAPPPWTVECRAGPAADLLSAGASSGRSVRIVVPDAPALILGSAQPIAAADLDACARAGVEVVRRTSGGGAVLVRPGAVLWVDIVVPAGDPLWEPDVARAFFWLGEAWAAALGAVAPMRAGARGAFAPMATGALGVPAGACAVAPRGTERSPGGLAPDDGLRLGHYEVHRGPAEATRWSRQVCFAGLGQGEVTVARRKVVGISQRRTRAGSLFQSAVHLLPGPSGTVDGGAGVAAGGPGAGVAAGGAAGVAAGGAGAGVAAGGPGAGVADVADVVAVDPGERLALRDHLERSVAVVAASADALVSALIAALP